jgi:hypothetical protein
VEIKGRVAKPLHERRAVVRRVVLCVSPGIVEAKVGRRDAEMLRATASVSACQQSASGEGHTWRKGV